MRGPGGFRRLWKGRGPAWSAARVGILLAVLLSLTSAGAYLFMLRMPGTSNQRAPREPTARERATAKRLERHVRALAEEIGPRPGDNPAAQERAVAYIEAQLEGLSGALRRDVHEGNGHAIVNVELRLPGAAPELVVGAHYDTVPSTPGANDNASGVAAMLELAQRFAATDGGRGLRFVAFDQEEPPYSHSKAMGSLRYARGLAASGVELRGMLALETIGYYTSEPGSQQYPVPGIGLLYPNRGDFLAFVTGLGSRALLHETIGGFRRSGAPLPSEGAALPGALPGIGWSDHWAFWQAGYPAVMVTDTALHRDPAYHTPRDTPERLDYVRMARAVEGLAAATAELTERPVSGR